MCELPSIGLKKLALCASILFACMFARGSSVEWDRMEAVDAEVWDSGPLWQIWGYSSERSSINPVIMVTFDGLVLNASPYMGGQSTISVKGMSRGDLVDSGTMARQSDGYFYQSTFGSDFIESDYGISTDSYDPVYLAFSTIAYDDIGEAYSVYGWVEISVAGGEPNVMHSAWNVDGGAMIVGSGAIPEPTSGLLFLFGLAALALRRGGVSCKVAQGNRE